MGLGHWSSASGLGRPAMGVRPFLDKLVISCQLGPHRLVSIVTLLSLSPNEKPGSER